MNGPAQLTIYAERGVNHLVRRLEKAETAGEFISSLGDFKESRVDELRIDWDFGGACPSLGYEKSGKNLLPGLEAENAIKIFTFLGDMSSVAASDRRLWTYLSCNEFLEYTTSRWPLADKSWRGTAETRWLMKTGSRSQLVRHAIARLWWAAKLTYDPNMQRPLSKQKNDPYAYLRSVLDREDRFLALFDRDTGMVPELRFAVLEHIEKNPSYKHEDYIRELMKEIVLVAGYRELGVLDSAGLHTTLEEISLRLDETTLSTLLPA